MSQTPFSQRAGMSLPKPIDNCFPDKARIGLANILSDLMKNGFGEEENVMAELYRSGRFIPGDIYIDTQMTKVKMISQFLSEMEWVQVYTFCERVYSKVLQAGYYDDSHGGWVGVDNIADAREYYSNEINNLLNEENLGFQFINGQFQRRGRAQTQKSIQRMGLVLSDPKLAQARTHFNKAQKLFEQKPDPDLENCIKEAICAFEACVLTLTKNKASTDFIKVLRQLSGNGNQQIPAPLTDMMGKLYAYRGSGQGVAHAAPDGNKVTALEAELVLNLVASFITYLYDVLSEPDEDIPF
jgi:hypothetical protein